MPCPKHSRSTECGVTLIEMVIAISITAIIAGAVAVFVSRPVEGYMDASRRAEMTDIADTALRRITRDLRTALPNSIRTTVVGNVSYLEYLQTSHGARYRAEKTIGDTGDPLDFTIADSSFDVIGADPTQWIPAPVQDRDSIVIYNLASSGTTANAYSGDNRWTYWSSTATTITLKAPGYQFPFASPGKRFQVVQYAVTYECNEDTRELRRYWDYGISASQPTPPATTNNALLATDIRDCSFAYSSGATQRSGVVSLFLEVERSGELIRLFQQAHVNNVP